MVSICTSTGKSNPLFNGRTRRGGGEEEEEEEGITIVEEENVEGK